MPAKVIGHGERAQKSVMSFREVVSLTGGSTAWTAVPAPGLASGSTYQ